MGKQGAVATLILAAFGLLGATSIGEREDSAVAAAEGRPGLTIYSGNFALVRHEIGRPLPAGTQTVRIDGLPTNADVSSLLVLNADVTLLGTHGFRSYQDAAGSGAALDLDLEVSRPVESLRLAYLTTGLNWSADYAVIVAADESSARVDGYATLVNGSGAGYEGAEVQLLAGQVNRGGGRFEAEEFRTAQGLDVASSLPQLQESAFGDYHLYTVPTPLSLRSGESRRIHLTGGARVVTRKEYTFVNSLGYHRQEPEPLIRPVEVSYVFDRSGSDDFSTQPLPGGTVRILQPDEAGRVQLLGIASLRNTPKEQDVRLSTGYAFNIVGTRTQTEYSRPGGNVYESAWQVTLKNESDADVSVQVIERLGGDWQIVESTHPAEKLSAGAVRFRVDVAADGEAVLEYRVSVRT